MTEYSDNIISLSRERFEAGSSRGSRLRYLMAGEAIVQLDPPPAPVVEDEDEDEPENYEALNEGIPESVQMILFGGIAGILDALIENDQKELAAELLNLLNRLKKDNNTPAELFDVAVNFTSIVDEGIYSDAKEARRLLRSAEY